MGADYVKECRERVRNSFGSDFADKASEAVLRALGATGGSPQPVRAIVELAPVAQPAPGLPEAVAYMRGTAAWQEVLKSAGSVLRNAGDEGLASRAEALITPAALMRDVYVEDMRAKCHRAARSILEALMWSGQASPGTAETSVHPQPTDYCWLNQTIRTWSSTRALADVAAAPDLLRIDLPRPLRREISMTGGVVGATPFRAARKFTGKGLVVAVIDGEVDQAHRALEGRVVRRANLSGEDWGEPDVHGTAVAGIITARGDSMGQADMMGIAPDAIVYNYKVFRTRGVNQTDDFDAATALRKAVEDKVKIVNCSWGTEAETDGSSREVLAVENAWSSGVTVVKSAGDLGKITSPGDAAGVILVGATTRDGVAVPAYSGRGPTQNGRNPDMVAPGGDDGIDKIVSCLPGGGFGLCVSGTSLAAPHVAGLLALLLESQPDLTPHEQRQRLIELCVQLNPAFTQEVSGNGCPTLAGLI